MSAKDYRLYDKPELLFVGQLVTTDFRPSESHVVRKITDIRENQRCESGRLICMDAGVDNDSGISFNCGFGRIDWVDASWALPIEHEREKEMDSTEFDHDVDEEITEPEPASASVYGDASDVATVIERALDRIDKQNQKIKGLRQAVKNAQRNAKFHAKMTDYLVASLINKAKTSL